MSENWKEYKLGDVATLQRGFDLPNSKRLDGDYPVISASGVNSWHNEYKVKGPGVTTGRSGTLGQVFYEDRDFWPLNTTLWVKNFHCNNPRFIYYFLQTLNFKEYNSGTSVPTLNRNDVHKLEVQLPLLPEQKAIASILSSIDDKIENNLAMNKTLEEMAMALYKHWFVDFGPFQEGEFVESELGLIPKSWEVKIVQEFGTTITGKTPSKKYPEHFGDDMPFVTPTDFKDYGKHILSSKRYISKSGIEKYKRNVIPDNSVIVTCIGSDMGKVAISKCKCITNQQINSLKCDNYLFMYYFFVYSYSKLKRLAGDGTTMPIINKSRFESLQVLFPGKQILKYFEEQLRDLDEQVLVNSKENQTLTKLRDTLLPKLISGEVRLKEFRKELEKVI